MKNLLLILISLVSNVIFAQNYSELEWTISFKNNHIIFECSKGCNYSVLSFDDDRKVVLNENAFTKLNKKIQEQESNFLVQYSKSDNQIFLEGIKGVNWKTLTFTRDSNLKYHINQNGEIQKNNIIKN